MTDTDRLAALLQANALPATVGVTTNEDYWHVLAARLVMQGVRVGDDGPVANRTCEVWKAADRACALWFDQALPDDNALLRKAMLDLRAALAAQPAPTLDRERLRRAIYAVSIRHDWANTTDTEDRTDEIADEYENEDFRREMAREGAAASTGPDQWETE